ncbi:MAG: glycosyltransferase family 4 protein [Bacteroidota bacterium]
MKNKQYTIGTNALGYPETRNFAGHQYDEFTFKKVIDFYKIPSHLLFKINGKINRKWQNSFNDFGLNGCHFFHFFNVLNEGHQPYLTTYETQLPRWRDTDIDFIKGLNLIEKTNCRQLIALSQCAYEKQTEIIQRYRPELLDIIQQKNRVLLPPQPLFINDMNEKKSVNKKIVFTIVGADFFRKGGEAILRAFSVLLNKKSPVQLNIVSALNHGDYVSKTTLQDLANAKAIIARYPDGINWMPSLSNTGVKELLLKTDVALLPSLAETFGYFTLEAQAAGCPVITTDIRAMPEINSNEKGWIIPIKESRYDIDLAHTEKALSTISEQLISLIEDIVNHPDIIKRKGAEGLLNIKQKHSPLQHKETLYQLYKSIIN